MPVFPLNDGANGVELSVHIRLFVDINRILFGSMVLFLRIKGLYI